MDQQQDSVSAPDAQREQAFAAQMQQHSADSIRFWRLGANTNGWCPFLPPEADGALMAMCQASQSQAASDWKGTKRAASVDLRWNAERAWKEWERRNFPGSWFPGTLNAALAGEREQICCLFQEVYLRAARWAIHGGDLPEPSSDGFPGELLGVAGDERS